MGWDESIHLCEVNRSQLGCCVRGGKGKRGRARSPPLNKRGDRMHPHSRGQTHHPVAAGEEQLPLSWVSRPLLERRVNPHGAWSMSWDFPFASGSENWRFRTINLCSNSTCEPSVLFSHHKHASSKKKKTLGGMEFSTFSLGWVWKLLYNIGKWMVVKSDKLENGGVGVTLLIWKNVLFYKYTNIQIIYNIQFTF